MFVTAAYSPRRTAIFKVRRKKWQTVFIGSRQFSNIVNLMKLALGDPVLEVTGHHKSHQILRIIER